MVFPRAVSFLAQRLRLELLGHRRKNDYLRRNDFQGSTLARAASAGRVVAVSGLEHLSNPWDKKQAGESPNEGHMFRSFGTGTRHSCCWHGHLRAQAAEKKAKLKPEDFQAVEMFAAMKSGDIKVEFIPKDATAATVIIHNNSGRPLSVKLPDAFAGVPVLCSSVVAVVAWVAVDWEAVDWEAGVAWVVVVVARAWEAVLVGAAEDRLVVVVVDSGAAVWAGEVDSSTWNQRKSEKSKSRRCVWNMERTTQARG